MNPSEAREPASPHAVQLAQELLKRIVTYGATSDPELIGPLGAFYLRALDEIPEAMRLEMVVAVAKLADEQKVSVNALMPFVFRDTAPSVVATAALHAAELGPASLDPLSGVKEFVEHAKRLAERGEESRAAAILSGLVLLGDRRVMDCLGPCWRWLSLDGRHELARTLGARPYAAVIDWLVDWLEDCEGREFGLVAGALARLPTERARPFVGELRRIFPSWTVAPDEVVDYAEQWSFEQYAERLRPRLLQLAADEAPPRIMHDVLRSWGISHVDRHAPGIWMKHADSAAPRDLLPLLPRDAGEHSRAFDFVPLEDMDFVARGGDLLLCWSIFNPYGPTWSCLGRLPTEEPGIDLLFYRVLNPFAQQSGAIASLHGDHRTSGTVIGDVVRKLFRRNVLLDGDEGVVMLGGGPPDLVVAPWDDDTFQATIPTFFISSPRMAEFDVAGTIEHIRKSMGDPWKRASLQRDFAFAHVRPDGLIHLPEPKAPTTQQLILDWLELIMNAEHTAAELVCYPGAWHGAIDHAGGSLGPLAFTFWQLDDFLSRFGFPVFRTKLKGGES